MGQRKNQQWDGRFKLKYIGNSINCKQLCIPNKRQRLSDWFKSPQFYAAYMRYIESTKTQKAWKVQREKGTSHEQCNH